MDLRAYKLATIEANFKKTLNASGRQFKGEAGEFPGVVKLTSVDTKGFYYPEVSKKDKVWLHGTAGVLSGDLWTLSQQNNHVSVAYVLARDGSVYQLFPDEFYSYHLGGSSSAPNSYWSKHSVAIEISNLLCLTESPTDPNLLIDAYNKPYCLKTDKQFYTELPEPYRGYKFWASFTDAQYEATDQLVKHICEKHGITLSKLPFAKAYDYCVQVPNETLLFHTNCRKDKVDFSPAFDLNRIGTPEPISSNPTPAPTKPTPQTIHPNVSSRVSRNITVQAGDTFWSISNKLKISVQAILAVNPGVDPTKLQIGQTLLLP